MSDEAYVALFGEKFNKPDYIDIRVVDQLSQLEDEVKSLALFGWSGRTPFGNAFVQGNRLNFSTAMSFGQLLDIAMINQAQKGDTLEEVQRKSNRPKQVAHASKLKTYLLDTACAGAKFIIPAMTLNCGADFGDTELQGRPILLLWSHAKATRAHGNMSWPAALMIPSQIKLPTTDGGHRYNQFKSILESSAITDHQKAALLDNAIDVRIVFEPDHHDAQQDFADCGKAKPIASSSLTSYDRRDDINAEAQRLVMAVPFLQINIDATAASANLSAKSKRVWAMTSMRMLVDQVVQMAKAAESAPDQFDKLRIPERVDGLERFVVALIAHVPTLAIINAAQTTPPATGEIIGPQTLRSVSGGDIVLLAAFLALAARAFHHAKQHGIDVEDMAVALGRIDWHVLDCERSDVDEEAEIERKKVRGGKLYHEVLFGHIKEHLRALVTVQEGRFRVTPSGKDIGIAWETKLRDLVIANLPPRSRLSAAE